MQEPHSNAVKCAGCEQLSLLAKLPHEARFELVGCFVGKGDDQYVLQRHGVLTHKLRNTGGKHTCFATARACDDADVAAAGWGGHGSKLLVGQGLQVGCCTSGGRFMPC